MSRYIPKKIRLLVAQRAFLLCEYCLLHDSQSFIGFEIDHIISLQHGGSSDIDNLANTCLYCNQNKGPNVGSILLPSNEFIRFYNPRKDRWDEHFEISGTLILPKTNIGEATIKILKMNDVERLMERQVWENIGMFPHQDAAKIIY